MAAKIIYNFKAIWQPDKAPAPPHVNPLENAAAIASGDLSSQPVLAQADITLGCPATYSPSCAVFSKSLFEHQQAGWESLKSHGLAELFQGVATERAWHVALDSAQDFFNFAVTAALTGDTLLYCLQEVMVKAGRTHAAGRKKALPEPARQVLLAFCSVAIERWVNHVASAVPLPPPDLASGMRLTLDAPWVVYLVAAAAFQRKSRLTPESGSHATHIAEHSIPPPPALIMAYSPVDPGSADLLEPVRAALNDAYRGYAVVRPALRSAHSTPLSGYIKGNMGAINAHLGGDVILGVRFNDPGNTLLNLAVRQAAYAEFNAPTVEFGDDGQCDAALRDFAANLQQMIYDVSRMLHSDPEILQGDPMPKTPIINNFNASVYSVGDHNQIAQAVGAQSQAAIGNIHNQGVNAAAFETLLDAFLAEVCATPALAGKRSYVAERVTDLKTLATALDSAQDGGKGAKRLLDDLSMAVDGVDAGMGTADKIIGKLGEVKAWAIGYWPLLLELFKQPGGAA
jgi:hypothetical protein